MDFCDKCGNWRIVRHFSLMHNGKLIKFVYCARDEENFLRVVRVVPMFSFWDDVHPREEMRRAR